MYKCSNEVFYAGPQFDLIGELVKSVNDCAGFMTGSAVIGGFGPDSDIDLVFPIYTAHAADRMLELKSKELLFKTEASNYNGGYKLVKPGSTTLNVITLHPYDYCAWLFATNTLKNQSVIFDRFTRHRAFELAVTLFKLANASARYVTVAGSESYYSENHSNMLINEFEEFVKKRTNNN